MNALLGRRWADLAREHIPTLTTSQDWVKDATSLTVRCSCGDELGTYSIPDEATDTCERLVQELAQVWTQLQVLHHRNAKLITEQGWIQADQVAEQIKRQPR